ncbi:hypothetical protein BXZ70DRAFT_929237 [Cristinia sonorae]|uniref:Uncharacterized protein n=1 Tax=Cristinia sonorae TaxID=1940300 RepID=A0A8K0XRK9_9AGAR|nr:hypothetical protein BXZ70DRAFT_929237 [Cristinia sonorae]
MIIGLAKWISQFLAPVLSLASLIVLSIVYFAPVGVLHTGVSLLIVKPTGDADGPTVFVGALGSCGRPDNVSAVNCTQLNVQPTYNISVLPSGTPDLLTAPVASTPIFIGVSLVFTLIFFFMFTFLSLRHKMGKAASNARFESPGIQHATSWIGLIGFLMGSTSFLVTRMWFGKTVEDFNKIIARDGSSAPQIVADIGNGFTMAWIAYALFAVPLVSSMTKLQATAPKKKPAV